MLFTDARKSLSEAIEDDPQRISGVMSLIQLFNTQFPKVLYELVQKPMLVNAQALVVRGQRIVKLFGGLALHPLIERDALMFALLHETGHHLAEGPRLPWNPFLACECQADLWARSEAASWGCMINLSRALSNIEA